MANPEHLAILKRGVGVWNAWRKNNWNVLPNLSEADLSGADLRRADFIRANLFRANLSGANLNIAKIDRANLREANLSGANLWSTSLFEADINAANLRETNLRQASLSGANLKYANLVKADLNGVNLWGANLWGAHLRECILKEAFVGLTNFGKLNLSEVKGLKIIKHNSSSTVGMDTIFMSKGKIPEVFLRGCGLSDWQIEFAKLAKLGLDREQVTQIGYDIVNLYSGQGLQFYSCFINYNSADQEFAQKIHDDLQNNGVRCWFAPEDMKIGDRIRPRIDQEIRLRDKLLVILSENSIASEWVGDEVEAAQEEENASSCTILFPIRLDDAVMESSSDWAAKIKRRRHIGDFSEWQNEGKYQKAFERLLRDLKSIGGE